MNEEQMTVGELIEELKKHDKDMVVKYTMGGSCNFGDIDFIDIEQDGYYDEDESWIDGECLVIGELTW